jgi:crotonyl-CoA carboxylase/reductase
MIKDLYEIGEIPPIGHVPARMHAQLVRPDRYGEPRDAIRDEVIDVPAIGPRDALVMVMAAGLNFNNVWAARGVPVDVTRTQARWGEPTDFHIVGSDASGVVAAVGSDVTGLSVGDHVVVHAGQWDADDPWVVAGNDPGLAASFRVWGYDTCWGSMAQFTKV